MILINHHDHTLGEAVFVARRRAGLSQQQLATKLGCYASEIGAWENGRRSMQARTWVRIMQVCGQEVEVRSIKE